MFGKSDLQWEIVLQFVYPKRDLPGFRAGRKGALGQITLLKKM